MWTRRRGGKRQREQKSAARVDLERATVSVSEASGHELACLAPPAGALLARLELTMDLRGTDGGLCPGHRDAGGRPGPDLHLDGALLGEPLRALDRKSTRLNSSHVKITYDV